MLRVWGGCGEDVVGVVWSWVRCCGCGVVVGKMLRVWGGCGEDVVGVVWSWVSCCGRGVVMGVGD